MLTNLSLEMIRVIREVELAIIENKSDLISKEKGSGRLTEKEIQKALFDYLKEGEKVTPASDDYFDTLKAIVVNNSKVPTWHVDFDLWIDSKQSDLTLSLELYEKNGIIKPSIEDLHIM